MVSNLATRPLLQRSAVVFWASVYPLAVLFGQLLFFFSEHPFIINTTRVIESHLAYFSDKRNILNRVFVKQGWFWSSVLFIAIFAWTRLYNRFADEWKSRRENGGNARNSGIPETDMGSGEVAESGNTRVLPKLDISATLLTDYATASLVWFLYAQWCFGPALMDRVFTLSGGTCQLPSDAAPPGPLPLTMKPGSPLLYVSSSACRREGGAWTDGFDPSGHCFLLTHMSLFIVVCVVRIWQGAKRDGAFSLTVLDLLLPGSDGLAAFQGVSGLNGMKIATRVVAGLAGFLFVLWGWMIFITGVFFHNFLENLAGMAAGYVWFGLTLMYR